MKTTTARNFVPAALVGAALIGLSVMPNTAHAQGRIFRGAGGYQRVPDAGYAPDHPGRGSLTWSGDVDDSVIIEIHGSDVHSHVVHGKDITKTHVDMNGLLPDRPMHVSLRQWDGRGEVRLIQQPTPGNDFTAAVRIHDPQGGRGHYVFTLVWRPLSGGDDPDAGY